MGFTRRRLLTAAATASATALAGCADVVADESGGSGATTTQASFFVFGDVAATITGDAAESELLVPVGQHGHGWEPGPRVREAIDDADLFVHGPESFQPWVDDVLGDLDADGADVTTVDASDGVDLLSVEDEHDEDHAEEDHDKDETDAEHDDETDTEHENETQTEHDDHDDHDHGPVDPHFWLDPTRLTGTVDAVESALIDVDPENEESYAENAAAYRDELAGVDQRIADTVDAGATDTILVAGHGSFRYLEDRYGVHVESLTGLSPDDQPTARDIEHAQAVVAEHDLQYVCADPLESQRAAEQLVAETDAEEVLPLTAMPGLTDEWDENGWGYVDVMTEVNVPTLERALDA